MKKFNLLIMCALFILVLSECIRYFYAGFIPGKFDMLFLYIMTMLGIGNYILDELNK